MSEPLIGNKEIDHLLARAKGMSNANRDTMHEALIFVRGTYERDRASIATGAIAAFVAKVKEQAERNMAHTGVVSGAHWNAMRVVLKEMGLEVEI